MAQIAWRDRQVNAEGEAHGLAPYEKLFRSGFLRGLETKGRIMTGLAHMTDDEIDRLCKAL